MRFRGHLTKSGKWYAAEVPLLGINTQGESKTDAYAMVKDAIESLVDKAGFKVAVHPRHGNDFEVDSNDPVTWIAFLLRRQRLVHGLSLAEVAERTHAKSRNAFARYERGEAVPSADKLFSLLQAINPDHDVVLD